MLSTEHKPAFLDEAAIVDEAIMSRRSVRAFLPEPIDEATVRAILEVAARAPSGTNMQPWRVYVTAGKVKEEISRAILESVLLGDRVILMSAQPGRRLATFEIDLPRPRTIDVMNTPRFVEYRAQIWERLSSEVTRAMEMQQ